MLLVVSRYGNWEKLCNLMDHIIRVLTSSNVVRQSQILLCPPHNYEVKLGLKWLETIPNMSNFSRCSETKLYQWGFSTPEGCPSIYVNLWKSYSDKERRINPLLAARTECRPLNVTEKLDTM